MININNLPEDVQILIWKKVYNISIQHLNKNFNDMKDFVPLSSINIFEFYNDNFPCYKPYKQITFGKGVFWILNCSSASTKTNSVIKKDYLSLRKQFFPKNGYHSKKAIKRDLKYSKMLDLEPRRILSTSPA
tara:strand:- start:1094 stop:1489 length:396 start_codon:yes stop_codon:yes gene_type:complete